MESNLTQHLQDQIIYLAATDTGFGKAVSGVIQQNIFVTEPAQIIWEITTKYLKQFGKAPADNVDHLHDEVIRYSDGLSGEKKRMLSVYVEHLQSMNPPDPEYVLSRVNGFVTSRAYMSAAIDFAEMVDRGNLDDAKALMYDALKAGVRSKNVGVDLLSSTPERGTRPPKVMSMRIAEMDQDLWFEKNDLVVVAGQKGGSKSWFGHHLGRAGLTFGLNVLHVSHENSQVNTEIRYDQMFGALLRNRPGEVELRTLNSIGQVSRKLVERDCVFNLQLVMQNRERMQQFGGRLIVRKFPMYSCTPFELKSYIDYLVNFEDFKPDLVINDYADVMAPPSGSSQRQSRDVINEIYMIQKGIADDLGCVWVTPSQISDEGWQRFCSTGRMEGPELSEDKRKHANIDVGLYVGMVPEMERDYEAIVGCFKNRNGRQGRRCIIGQNLDIGQFCTYSRPMDEFLFQERRRRRQQNL